MQLTGICARMPGAQVLVLLCHKELGAKIRMFAPRSRVSSPWMTRFCPPRHGFLLLEPEELTFDAELSQRPGITPQGRNQRGVSLILWYVMSCYVLLLSICLEWFTSNIVETNCYHQPSPTSTNQHTTCSIHLNQTDNDLQACRAAVCRPTSQKAGVREPKGADAGEAAWKRMNFWDKFWRNVAE